MKIAEGSEELQQALMEVTVAKAITVMEKLESDSLTRFRDTLQTLRGYRLLGYQFVKEGTYEALMEEIEFVQLLPLAVPLIVGLRAELRT